MPTRLVFAINVAHAKLLADRLRHEGVMADYVASYCPGESPDETGDEDEADKANKGILERFRDNGSGLDILINVQMLTEGVDIPKIQTVFLTRPTNSEILLRQMIGRALRGPRANGTEKAYLLPSRIIGAVPQLGKTRLISSWTSSRPWSSRVNPKQNVRRWLPSRGT